MLEKLVLCTLVKFSDSALQRTLDATHKHTGPCSGNNKEGYCTRATHHKRFASTLSPLFCIFIQIIFAHSSQHYLYEKNFTVHFVTMKGTPSLPGGYSLCDYYKCLKGCFKQTLKKLGAQNCTDICGLALYRLLLLKDFRRAAHVWSRLKQLAEVLHELILLAN